MKDKSRFGLCHILTTTFVEICNPNIHTIAIMSFLSIQNIIQWSLSKRIANPISANSLPRHSSLVQVRVPLFFKQTSTFVIRLWSLNSPSLNKLLWLFALHNIAIVWAETKNINIFASIRDKSQTTLLAKPGLSLSTSHDRPCQFKLYHGENAWIVPSQKRIIVTWRASAEYSNPDIDTSWVWNVREKIHLTLFLANAIGIVLISEELIALEIVTCDGSRLSCKELGATRWSPEMDK